MVRAGEGLHPRVTDDLSYTVLLLPIYGYG
ncbi:hypothetical protein COLO4_13172 [Corchorus olitorius]|uniref:Uncharacterized protein n=1 Tax=Corchorus olitorius TaxID=93759 RepID=A0A1R3JXS5_9ROSI|nr:hypothetical protein COLO4_13172 [Corchorus olitorius]